MNRFELTILGSNSAAPAHGRYPTSQVLQVGQDLILIDCGEGCQMRMSDYKIKRNSISMILISHLHGDHIYGLPGLIGSFSHFGRKHALKIIGPVGIKEFLNTALRLSQAHMNFDLDIVEIEQNSCDVIFESENFKVSSFPVNHRIQTFGYLIEEKLGLLNISKDAIDTYKLSIDEIRLAKRGEDVIRADGLISYKDLTRPHATPRSYAYCADTTVDGWDKSHLEGINTMYFESTYLHDMWEQAHERKHSTAREAGELAKKLKIKQLIIGHYSSRYRSVQPLLEEAKSVFENTHAGYDGFILKIR